MWSNFSTLDAEVKFKPREKMLEKIKQFQHVLPREETNETNSRFNKKRQTTNFITRYNAWTNHVEWKITDT